MVKVRYREISPELEKLATPIASPTSRVSIGFEEEVGEFYYFPVEDLVPYKNQARMIFDEEEIDKLAETIKQHGIRQPLSILKSNTQPDKYEVVSGERRLRAAKKAGLGKVPCILLKDENVADEISLIENIQREDLHPLELARAIKVLYEKLLHGEKAELGKRIGLSRSQLSELHSLTNLPLSIQEILLSKNVRGREHFRKLNMLKDENSQKQYLKSVEDGMSTHLSKKKARLHSKSLIRISMVDGILKTQSFSLNRISDMERKVVKQALLSLVEQLDNPNVRGREHLSGSRN